MRNGPFSLVAFVMLATASRSARADGIDGELATTATLGLTDSLGWTGQDDGTKAAVGFAMRGILELERGAHTWDSRVDVEAAIGKARGAAEVAKARDGVSLESVWRWRAVSWWGTFARVSLEASPLPSSLDHDSTTTHSILETDGRRQLVDARSLGLTDPGAPLRLRQDVGPVLLPVEVDPARVAIHLGAAARETFADGQLAVSDDPTTPFIDVEATESAMRAGMGGGVEVEGVISVARLRYRARIDLMTPFLYPERPGNERGALNFTDVDLRAELSFRLVSWASLDYAFQALREPLVLNDYRVRNALFLSVGPTVSFSSAH